MRKIIIALDVMGGDFGPHISLSATLEILQLEPALTILVVGDKNIVLPLLQKYKLENHPRIFFHHADNTILMNDDPIYALRHITNSSMEVALRQVASGEADACVSGGNTGALMLFSRKILKPIHGSLKTPLVSALPNTLFGNTYLLDLGANLHCDPDTLFKFALMGSVLCENVEQIDAPKVALLNVGHESNKGSSVIKRTADLLHKTKHINYIGFIEGDELFSGRADVIITDGFTGNIALKSVEGVGRLFNHQLQKAFSQNWILKFVGRLLQPILKKLLKHMDPDLYNGASLLGLSGIVVKSHGSANVKAFIIAFEQAVKEVQWQIPRCITEKLETVLLERDNVKDE